LGDIADEAVDGTIEKLLRHAAESPSFEADNAAHFEGWSRYAASNVSVDEIAEWIRQEVSEVTINVA
jgi:hypothetical protein